MAPLRALAASPLVLLLCLAAAHAAAPPLQLPRDLSNVERARLESVARDAFVSTRVEGPTHFMRPEIFEYLLDHPEFATHITRALRLARYRIWHDGQGVWLDDGWGTRGRFTLVHAAPGRRLYY